VEISLIRSTDGGATWSDPVAVTDVTVARQWNYPEAYPDLSVAPSGRVDIAWYDWRKDWADGPDAEDGQFQDVYFTWVRLSDDGPWPCPRKLPLPWPSAPSVWPWASAWGCPTAGRHVGTRASSPGWAETVASMRRRRTLGLRGHEGGPMTGDRRSESSGSCDHAVTTCPPVARLRAELEAALVEAGFALHDCPSGALAQGERSCAHRPSSGQCSRSCERSWLSPCRGDANRRRAMWGGAIARRQRCLPGRGWPVRIVGCWFHRSFGWSWWRASSPPAPVTMVSYARSDRGSA
jgi:hypothetical protein